MLKDVRLLLVLIFALLLGFTLGSQFNDMSRTRRDAGLFGRRMDVVLNDYPGFAAVSWQRQRGADPARVAATCHIPVADYLKVAGNGREFWLPRERQYYNMYAPEITDVALRFDFSANGEVMLHGLRLGLATRERTVWTAPLPPAETRRVCRLIEDKGNLAPVFMTHAYPVLWQGGQLYARLTGETVF